MDGSVASLPVATVTGPTTGMCGQVLLAPLSFPVRQGATGHAEVPGSVMASQPAVACPTVEDNRVPAHGAICFASLALSGPATFQGFLGMGIPSVFGIRLQCSSFGTTFPGP